MTDGSNRHRAITDELKSSLVTSPSHRILNQDGALTRGQARRMSRRFGDVGVVIPATRLRQLAAGACAGDAELADVSFALAATEIEREQRHAKLKRSQRRAVWWLIVAGLILLILTSLFCMAYLFFGLALQAYSY
jgi:hypothetical protein